MSFCSLASAKQVLFVVLTHMLPTLVPMPIEKRQHEFRKFFEGAPRSVFSFRWGANATSDPMWTELHVGVNLIMQEKWWHALDDYDASL